MPHLVDVKVLRHHLARAAHWHREVRRGQGFEEVPDLPPTFVLEDILARLDPALPVLARITEVPVFAPDGSLIATPGYHAPSGIYYQPPPDLTCPPIPERPTAEQIDAARHLILTELLGDFPFVGAAERAHAVALLLLPFVRELIDGPTPLHLIEKPAPGTGAGLLTEVLALPSSPRGITIMTEGRDEDEWRKRLTSKLRELPTYILIDNLRHRLDSAQVSAAITAPVWEDRLLGGSTMLKVPVRCAWIASGNNPALSDEIARRSVRIRLDARVDRPWLRTAFRHPKLLRWAWSYRRELLAAALTLVQAWLASDRPDGQRTLGTFDAWAHVMGGILATVEIDGFLGNLSDFYEASDTEGAAVRDFVAAWWARHGSSPVGVSELFALAEEQPDLFDLGAGSDKARRTRFGLKLGQLRDRQFGAYRIAAAGRVRRASQWRLVAVPVAEPEPPPAPECESQPPPITLAGERVNVGERLALDPERRAGTSCAICAKAAVARDVGTPVCAQRAELHDHAAAWEGAAE